MDNFRKKFVEEANELINELEAALLTLESNPDDKKIIEQIFRIMHSLKGSGAMFGFELISDLTHHLESIYDFIRNGKAKVDNKLFNLTFDSVDHLKKLLEHPEVDDNAQIKIENNLFIKKFNEIINQLEQSTSQTNNNLQENTSENSNQSKTYYIYFAPDEHIFDNGTNPLYLLDELVSLGSSFVIPKTANIPLFDEYNIELCYTSWEIILATSHTPTEISEVFIFVEDECKLTIEEIADKNLLLDFNFIEYLSKNKHKTTNFNIESLRNYQLVKKQPENKQTISPQEIKKQSETEKKSLSSIRVASDKLDQLMNLVSELVTTQARLSLFAENKNTPELLSISEDVQKLTRQLRDNAFDICLVPIENLVLRFKRLVRDLSGELNKNIKFETEGTETELDKTIIESLVEPIMHLLRNCLDHGIEDEETRKKSGKDPQGKITLRAFYSGANVNIQIQDDGAGIDTEKIRQKAIAKKIIQEDDVLTKHEIFNLIFEPGFSTAKIITDVSGRGVGMDVVKRKMSEIRGEVFVESELNVGTTFTIQLPLTLSIIDGLLVKINQTFFIIPLSAVNKIYEIEHKKLRSFFKNTGVFDGKQIPFLYLRDEFNMPENQAVREQVVTVKYQNKQMGLAVDNVIGEYQAVLKPLGRHYKKQEIISGATILGDGTVALVMDTNKTINRFANKIEEHV